jgi:uncharacterized protein (TIGR02996 family)
MTSEMLEQAIRERPDDEGLRLVYADWLEDQGDPRGELVRLDALLARAGHERRREVEMRRRQRELRKAIAGQELPPPLPTPTPPRGKPRVQITFGVDAEGHVAWGGVQKVELPFVVGVLADLCGHRRGLPPLRRRELVSIDARSFDAVLAWHRPQLCLEVAGEGGPWRLDVRRVAA